MNDIFYDELIKTVDEFLTLDYDFINKQKYEDARGEVIRRSKYIINMFLRWGSDSEEFRRCVISEVIDNIIKTGKYTVKG